ncbi:hypothetical protein HpCK40_06030 [Helicobacter pylori]
MPKIQPNKANKVRLSIKISFKENLPMLSNSFLAHKLTSFEPFKVGLQVLYANKGASKIKTTPQGKNAKNHENHEISFTPILAAISIARGLGASAVKNMDEVMQVEAKATHIKYAPILSGLLFGVEPIKGGIEETIG